VISAIGGAAAQNSNLFPSLAMQDSRTPMSVFRYPLLSTPIPDRCIRSMTR
jgi:hypothetical protein